MFDSISTHEFWKEFIFKMASLITDDCSGCLISAQNVSLYKPNNCSGIIYGTSYSSPIWIHNPQLGECIHCQMMMEKVP